MRRVVIGLIVVVASLVGPLVVVPANAAPKPSPEEHCIVRIIGQQPSGEYIASPPECFATMAGVQQSSAAAAASSTIGVHYDGANFTGSSFSVVGDNCGGGWLNVSFFWNNRVSSTWNGCPYIFHYDGTNLTGAWQVTVAPGGNLTTLNNKTSSIQYSS
jgi:hypothetical protein